MPQFVHGRNQSLLVQTTRRGEQLQGEVPAHRCGQPGQFPGGRGQPLEPVAQHRLDARRAGSLLVPRFDHEQRESAGVRQELPRCRAVERAAVQLGGKLGRLPGIQRRELEFLQHAPGAQPPATGHQFGVVVELFAAQRCHNQQRCGRIEVEQELEPGQRFTVAPLQIVEHQQCRLTARQHRPHQPLEELPALPGIGQWR